jgi:hypothetical protein
MYVEEEKIWAFNNSMLRRIFEERGKEVREMWRKLQNIKFHNLYYSSSNSTLGA